MFSPLSDGRTWPLIFIQATKGTMTAIQGRKLITVEPILDFDLPEFAIGLLLVKPEMVIIGADSKYCRLKEPGRDQIQDLLDVLKAGGLDVRQKPNLARLLR